MTISTEAGRLPVLVATFFGAGYSPVAPGTVGSLAALPLAFALLHMDILVATLIVIGLYFLGLWSANHLEKVSGQHDAQMIVIDEVVGVCVSALLLGWWLVGAADPYLLLLLSFFSFRLFDVVKPWPISWIDRTVGGGVGVMIDDLVAALMGAVAVAGGYFVLLRVSI
jgi:phosphatidylglycerophosphatase A